MVLRFALTLAACLLASSVAAPPTAAAEDAPLTLDMAIEHALAGNPELAGFVFRLRAHEARRQTAGLKPPVELRAEVENFLGTGRFDGVDAAEVSFALSQVIELGGKRGLRLDAVEAGRGLLETERAATQLDVLAEVTRRFIRVASGQEQLRLAQRATSLAEQTVSATEARLNAGRAPQVEVRRARIALARARVEQEHAEHELLAARRKLAAMWGATDDRFGTVTADLYELPAVEPLQALTARLAASADITRFVSEARLRDAELRLAEARQRADILYSAGIRRLQETRDQAFIVSVTVPLFSRDRGRGAIAEAQALRDQTEADRTAHRIRVEAQLFEIHQELTHSLTEARMLRNDVLPEMEATLTETRYAFEHGRYGYLEWIDAQRELIVLQRALIEASANAHLYRTEIERLTAQPLAVASQSGGTP